MRQEFQARSSDDFVKGLNEEERKIYTIFTMTQKQRDKATLCVFLDMFNNMKVCSTELTGRNDGLAEFIDGRKTSDPTHYHHLLMVLNLRRSFESQWRLPADFFDETVDFVDAFVYTPLITVQGLPDSPHNRFTVVQDREEPEMFTLGKPPRPEFSVIPGGLAR